MQGQRTQSATVTAHARGKGKGETRGPEGVGGEQKEKRVCQPASLLLPRSCLGSARAKEEGKRKEAASKQRREGEEKKRRETKKGNRRGGSDCA